MSYVVEVYFDEETEDLVRQVWERFDEAGLPGSLRQAGYRPHVSLGACEELDLKGFRAELAAFASARQALPLKISSLGLFPNREEVLFLGLTVTYELLNLHVEFNRIFHRHAQRRRDYYAVGSWVPHCTLAFNLNGADLDRAFTEARKLALPIWTWAVQIGVAEVAPGSCQSLYTADFHRTAG